jgi:predicted NUDIX family NTP pyrophosphohydrolase
MRHKESAGLLMFRNTGARLEVLLGHPGGPFWGSRHDGAWGIPKGGANVGEEWLDAAIREFREETGFDSQAPYLPLGQITQRGGKIVHAWAFEGDFDPSAIRSSTVTIEWPGGSGRYIVVPEIDRAGFFSIDDARRLMNPAQVAFLDRLREVKGA